MKTYAYSLPSYPNQRVHTKNLKHTETGILMSLGVIAQSKLQEITLEQTAEALVTITHPTLTDDTYLVIPSIFVVGDKKGIKELVSLRIDEMFKQLEGTKE